MTHDRKVQIVFLSHSRDIFIWPCMTFSYEECGFNHTHYYFKISFFTFSIAIGY